MSSGCCKARAIKKKKKKRKNLFLNPDEAVLSVILSQSSGSQHELVTQQVVSLNDEVIDMASTGETEAAVF